MSAPGTEKYRNQGLVVIGVHAPEFAFEKDPNNVRRAVKNMRIEYPVAVDNDHVIWQAFNNIEWPALYFVDAQGRVRHHYSGEGAYEQSEMVIQELLAEAGVANVSHEPVSVDARGIEAAADWSDLKSPENYVGYRRTQNFTSPGGAVLDQPRAYMFPARLRLNDWALSGDWTMKKPGRRAEQAQRTHRVPFSRPRSSSRHGPGGAGNIREISRSDRWTAARRGSRI